MKIATFELEDGGIVYVNIDHVASIHKSVRYESGVPATKETIVETDICTLWMTGDNCHAVVGPIDDIKYKIRSAVDAEDFH